MAKKKPGEEKKPKRYQVVLDAELARKIGVAASALDVSIPAWVNAKLAAIIDNELSSSIRQGIGWVTVTIRARWNQDQRLYHFQGPEMTEGKGACYLIALSGQGAVPPVPVAPWGHTEHVSWLASLRGAGFFVRVTRTDEGEEAQQSLLPDMEASLTWQHEMRHPDPHQ